MTEPTELLPCPFCGGVAKAFKRTCDKTTRYDPGDRAFPIVRCGVCGACSEGDDWSESKTAIDRWNRRSPPAGAGEVAEHYRNAIASACEGWTMPDGLRKHLESALWSPPTPRPTQAQARPVPLTNARLQDISLNYSDSEDECTGFRDGWRAAEKHHGIKGGQHVGKVD